MLIKEKKCIILFSEECEGFKAEEMLSGRKKAEYKTSVRIIFLISYS
jgi:hypothetical protein